jgi:RND family efflux transporter MFP subunit
MKTEYTTMARSLLGAAILLLPAANSYSQENLSAIVKAANSAILSAQIDGLIEQVHVKEGHSFVKNDVLLSLECSVQQTALKKAKAQLSFVSKENETVEKLASLNSASQLQIAQSKAELSKARSDVEAAKHQVSLCTVLAPYDGNVIQTWVNAHENIQAKSKMIEIVDNRELATEFLAPSHMLPQLTSGLEFELNIMETNKSYAAVIDRVIPRVDAVSQTVKVIGRLTTSYPELWSGMSGVAVLKQ